MGIQIGGLATGLDTSAIIEQLLAVERRPITLLETRKLKFQAQSTAFQDLNSKLRTLESAAEALRDPATLFARSASSSAESVLAATAAPGSTRGTFTVTVAGLARGSIAAAATTKTSLTDTVATGDGTFQFRLGPSGSVVSIAVDASTTLDELIQAINERNAGVKASAVNLGSATAPAWKLTLTSLTTGAASDIAIVGDGTTLGVTTTQNALDATFNVAGLGDFTRPGNTFSDVVEGVTITLRGTGTAELAVEVDKPGTEGRLQALVDAYNQVVRTIDQQAAATRGSDGMLKPGAFTGDVVPRQLRTGLAAILRTSVGGTLSTLADLGITTSRTDGTLAIDSARFAQALADDPDGVARLISGTESADGIADLLARAVEDATTSVTGAIAARQDGLSASIRSVERQIETALARLETTERLLRTRFTALEKTISQLQATESSLMGALQGLVTGLVI